ncbi:hypothetical protein [Thermanaeromonas sp. C210]|uniref:hypothetical protein n=1 Tax=Thermanaeromonas sp. C210 TaxID=2731925 RepID=UPI00155B77B6|nr:hypothetical protein [Thermanaeromonas sp. C210]GFN23438.1 hypothetical protein TAMC210_17550 [Thermanaeromonas sp. C210]
MGKAKKYLLIAAAAALIFTLGWGGMALAQGTDPAKPPMRLDQIFLEKLSGLLGLSQEELVSRLKTAGQQTVDAAVSEGLMSAEQGERMKQAIEEGRFPCGPGMFMFGLKGGPGGRAGMGYLGDVASILGMTPQELRDELRSGKTLEQLAAEKGLTLQGIKERLTEAVKGRLDQMVAQGKISREKADRIIERLQQLDLSEFPPGKGAFRLWTDEG